MTITEFLEARIAEDESEAEKGWDHNGTRVFARDNYGCLLIKPARVLAECAAKRAIIALNEVTEGSYWDTLNSLASVYASHPDFEQGWAL